MITKFSSKQLHILDIAEELIAENGFEETSVRQICAKAGVNIAMISYYFGSKEKMMSSLYEYRVQRSKEKFSEFTSKKSFSEFTDTIKDGTPKMQIKEVIKFITSQMFKYKYFHGFVKQEFRNTDMMQDELQEFYASTMEKLNDIIYKGVSNGYFKYAPKSEDLLAMIVGTVLFVIRNKRFYERYTPQTDNRNYLSVAEIKVRESINQAVFSLLGCSE